VVELAKSVPIEKTCFVISPIGAAGSDTRKRSDQVFKHIISKAVIPLGYKPTRADLIKEPGVITTQIIEQIVDAPLVIADLSDHNPNVFYELAVRHMTQKPLITLITRSQQIPFDVSANRVIQYDLADLDTVDQAVQEISAQERSMHESSKPIDNPISSTIQLKSLKASGDPQQSTIANIMESLQRLQNQVDSITRAVDIPTLQASTRHISHDIKLSEIEVEIKEVLKHLEEIDTEIKKLELLPQSTEIRQRLRELDGKHTMLKRQLIDLQDTYDFFKG